MKLKSLVGLSWKFSVYIQRNVYLRLQYKFESDQIPLLWHVILGVPSITVFISQKYVRDEPSVQFPGETVARGTFGGGPHSAVRQMIKEYC